MKYIKLIIFFVFLSVKLFGQVNNDCPEMTTYVYDSHGLKTTSFKYDFLEKNSITEYFYEDTLLVMSRRFNENNVLLGECFYEYSGKKLLLKKEDKTYIKYNYDPVDKVKGMKFIPDSSSEVTENKYDNDGNMIHTKLTWYPEGSITWEAMTEFKNNKPVKDICYPNEPGNRFEVIYFYDDSGRTKKTLTKHRESIYDHENSFFYDTNGLLVKNETYRDGNLSDYYIYQYNSSGLLTKTEYYYIPKKGGKGELSYFESIEYDTDNRPVKECSGSVTQVFEKK